MKRSLARTLQLLILVAHMADPSHAAELGVSAESAENGTATDTVTFAWTPAADGLIRSLDCLKVTVDASGASWRLLLHSSNPGGRPGLRPMAAAEERQSSFDTAPGVPLAWQVHEIRNPPAAAGSAYRDSWAPLRDHGESGWPAAVSNGEAVLVSGNDRDAVISPWPLPGRRGLSPFYVHLAADASRATAGEYAALLTVDLILLGSPPSGPRLRTHSGAFLDTTPLLAWAPAQEHGLSIAGYILQVDTTGRFAESALVESRTLAPNITSWRPETLAEGSVFWRIFAVDVAGNRISSEPERDSFLYGPVSAMTRGLSPVEMPAVAGGYRIRGNAVSLVSGYRSGLESVRFEFRSLPGGDWESCAVLGGTANPDTRGPHWGILWNIASLAPGYYDVRAAATPLHAPSETSPTSVRVYRTNDRYALSGDLEDAGEVYRERVRVPADTAGALRLFDGGELWLPRGAAGRDTAWITVVRRSRWSSAMPLLLGWTPAACLREFGVQKADEDEPGSGSGLVRAATWGSDPQVPGGLAPTSASTTLMSEPLTSAPRASALAAPIEIVVPWDPSLPASAIPTLALFTLDPTAGSWVRVVGAEADSEARAFRARVSSAGTFAVFAAVAAPDARAALVYPNPFVPNDGNTANGVPWAAGDPASGITFGNLPDRVEIDIFALTGERVRTMNATASAGMVRWDARNGAGRELASGVYLALIRGAGGDRTTRKIMIIR